MAPGSERGGDAARPASFHELYRTQYAAMVRLAHLLTGSVAIAEELVHGRRLQVEATLRDRPGVEQVELRVEGRTEGVFDP